MTIQNVHKLLARIGNLENFIKDIKIKHPNLTEEEILKLITHLLT